MCGHTSATTNPWIERDHIHSCSAFNIRPYIPSSPPAHLLTLATHFAVCPGPEWARQEYSYSMLRIGSLGGITPTTNAWAPVHVLHIQVYPNFSVSVARDQGASSLCFKYPIPSPNLTNLRAIN